MRTKLSLLSLLLLLPGVASAFTLKLHVYAANDVLRDVRDDQRVNLGTYGSYLVDDAVYEALNRFPEHYRGGSIGPDGYPDIFTGQVFTHTNQGEGLVEDLLTRGETSCAYALEQGWCRECQPPGAPTRCVEPQDNLVPFSWEDNGQRRRPKKYWRSIDWARFLLDKANQELATANAELAIARRSGDTTAIAAATVQRDQALQALAFSHGYLTHYAGDGFGHGWVNLYAGGAWNYFDAHLEYEYRHVIVEGYLQYVFEKYPLGSPVFDTLPPEAKDLTIAAPEWFIEKHIMREVVASVDDKSDSGAPSAAHIRMLYGYRETLEEVEKELGLETLPAEAPMLDMNNPGSYSSLWSYMLNFCATDLALSAVVQTSPRCSMLYKVVLREYIRERKKRTNEAILGWVTLSTNILQQGFLTSEGFEPGAIHALALGYYNNQLMPLVVPGEDEQLRQFLRGFKCKDLGPPNFERVCDEMMARMTKAVTEVQDQLEARLRLKFASYLEAFDRYLCILEEYAKKFAEPEKRMSFAYCGNFDGCSMAALRMNQVQTDVFLASSTPLAFTSGADPRNFIPFSNTVKMSKLSLLRRNDLRVLSTTANGLPGLEALPLIDSNARFLTDDTYRRILHESIATLDGSPPEAEDDLSDPKRVLFDQFRKAPVFALIADGPARQRIHWPLFSMKEQDPDGDQLLLTYDLCPCWAESRGDNARDSDGDHVGDGCDADFLFPDAVSQIRQLPDAGFGPPALGIKTSFTNRMGNTVAPLCKKDSSWAAAQHLENMKAEIRAHTENGHMDAYTSARVSGLVDDLIARLSAGAIPCADTPPAGSPVISCR